MRNRGKHDGFTLNMREESAPLRMFLTDQEHPLPCMLRMLCRVGLQTAFSYEELQLLVSWWDEQLNAQQLSKEEMDHAIN